jgi:hypothetical protein
MVFWRERNGQPRPPAIKVSRQCASSMTEPHGWLSSAARKETPSTPGTQPSRLEWTRSDGQADLLLVGVDSREVIPELLTARFSLPDFTLSPQTGGLSSPTPDSRRLAVSRTHRGHSKGARHF